MADDPGARLKARSTKRSSSESGSQSFRAKPLRTSKKKPSQRTTRSQSQSTTPVATPEEEAMEQDSCDGPDCNNTTPNYKIIFNNEEGEATSADICWRCRSKYKKGGSYRQGTIRSIHKFDEVSSEEEEMEEEDDRELLFGPPASNLDDCNAPLCFSGKPATHIIVFKRQGNIMLDTCSICEDCAMLYSDRNTFDNGTIQSIERKLLLSETEAATEQTSKAATTPKPLQHPTISEALQVTQDIKKVTDVTQKPEKEMLVTQNLEKEVEVTQSPNWQLDSPSPVESQNKNDQQQMVDSMSDPLPETPKFLPSESSGSSQTTPMQISNTQPAANPSGEAIAMMPMRFDTWDPIPLDKWYKADFPQETIPEEVEKEFQTQFKMNLKGHPDYDLIVAAWKGRHANFNSTKEVFENQETQRWIKDDCPPDYIPPLILSAWRLLIGRTPNTKSPKQFSLDLAELIAVVPEPFAGFIEKREKEIKAAQLPKTPPNQTLSYAQITQQQTSKDKPNEDNQQKYFFKGSESPDVPHGEQLIPPLRRTWCRITKKDVEGRRPPISDQAYTLWWDLKELNIPQDVILAKLDQEPIVGWSYRQGQEWVELAYETTPLRDEALNHTVYFEGYEDTVTPVKARRIGGSEIFIELVNVPQNRAAEDQMREALSLYGYVSDMAPVIYVDSTSKWSRRWNAILNIPEEHDLIMHPIIKVVGCEVVMFWQGSDPACTICFTKGHYSQDCNSKHRRRANKKRKDKLMPAPLLSDEKQRVIKDAKKRSEEDGITLVEAVAAIAVERKQLTADQIDAIRNTTDVLALIARLQLQGADNEVSTREEISKEAQINLANKGLATLPDEDDDFIEVKSQKQIREERKKQKNPSQPTPTQRPPQQQPPRSTTPTTKHPRTTPNTPSKGGERKKPRLDKRSKVSQEEACAYYHLVLASKKKDVEKIWKMTPSEYLAFKASWEPKQYKNMSDWVRKERSFDPSALGIESQRGKSPEPTPVPTNPPQASSSTGKLFWRNQKEAIHVNPEAKLAVTHPEQEIEVTFTFEDPENPGSILEGKEKIQMKAKFWELKNKIKEKLGREDFFFLFKGYRIGLQDRIGERLRDRNKIMLVGSWTTKDPQIASNKAKSQAEQYTKNIRLRISCEEFHKQVQGDFPDNTTGIAIQEFVAHSVGWKAHEPIVTYKDNPINLGQTLRQQGITGSSILKLSNLKYLAITVFYHTKAGRQTTKIYIPNNRNVVELKATLVKRIPYLKGKYFDVHDNEDEPFSDETMIRTKVQDGGGLAISLKNGGPIDGEEEDMVIDEEHEGQISITWGFMSTRQTKWLDFDFNDKTGQELYEAIKKFLDEAKLLQGEFTMTYQFHPIRLSDKLNWEGKQDMPVTINWGKSYVNPTQIATIIE